MPTRRVAHRRIRFTLISVGVIAAMSACLYGPPYDQLLSGDAELIDLARETYTDAGDRVALAVVDGDTSAGRCAAFARWRLDWEPGREYQYHPSSAHWVLAEIIERVSGEDFRDVVEQRVTEPAGLPRVEPVSIDLPNDHLGYAITWYSLALVLVVIYVLFSTTRSGSARS